MVLEALLAQVGPGVAAHPLPLTLGALVLPEAPLFALVGRESFTLRSGLSRVKKKKSTKKRRALHRFTETPLKKEKHAILPRKADVQGASAAINLM